MNQTRLNPRLAQGSCSLEYTEMPITQGTLTERRDQVVALLNDPNFDGDGDALMAEATEIEGGITAANDRRSKAEELRQRIVTSSAVTAAVEPETREAAPVVETRNIGREAAERLSGFDTGKRGIDFNGIDVRSVLTNASASGGAGYFVPLVPQPGVIPVNHDRPLRLADIINRQRTDSPIIEYVRDTTAKGGGSPVEVAEAGTKPETVYSFDLVSDTVKTVAHFTNITRAVVADVSQLQAYIESRLLYGLGYRLDNQIVNGDGSGVNLRGIFNTSGINVYSPAAAGTPYTEARVISIRRAMTPIYQNEYAPDTVGLSPGDWQYVELSEDQYGMFRVSPNVQNQITPRIWGLNVVPSTAFTDGTALIGDFKLGATLWDRMEATIYITDSHASNFTANVLTLLAEMRVGLAIHRVAAFTQCVFNPGASSSPQLV